MAYPPEFVASFARIAKPPAEKGSDIRAQRVASTCAGKEAFASRADASRLVDRKRKAHHGFGLAPYRCTVCGSWHVGSQKRGKLPSKAEIRRATARKS